MRTKTPTHDHWQDLSRFPSFSSTGSIRGMKKLYYGKDALLIKQGPYIYNVSSEPKVYEISKG